jgi:hypothetical protein
MARALERDVSVIHRVIMKNGGIAPAARTRLPLALTPPEREEISRGLGAGQSIRQIAAQLGRSPSTISREIERNGGALKYRACEADLNAWTRALRPKPCALPGNSCCAGWWRAN